MTTNRTTHASQTFATSHAVEPERRNHGYAAGTPRWAQLAAHAVPLVVLPSSLWRVLMTAGLAGAEHPDNPTYQSRWSDYIYVLLLSLVSEGLAYLTVGLVKPWGEVLPRWLPVIGARRVPVKAAVIPALVGSSLLALLAAYFFLNPVFLHVHFTPALGDKGTPDSHLIVSGWSKALFAACYLPLLAWPVLVTACALAYRRRRSAEPHATV